MGEKAPVPLAEEITRVCKEKGRGVKPGHSDCVLQYVALLFLGLERAGQVDSQSKKDFAVLVYR